MPRKKIIPATEGQQATTEAGMPEQGDTVNYIVPENHGDVSGKILRGTVKHVHEGHEGRLLNVEVELPGGPHRFGPTPYRDGKENAGNTWHWPDEPEKEPAK